MKMIILQMDSKSFLLIVLSAKDIKIELNNTPMNKYQGNWSLPLSLLFMITIMLWLPDGSIPFKTLIGLQYKGMANQCILFDNMVLMANKTTEKYKYLFFLSTIHTDVYGDGNPNKGIFG